MREPGGGGTLLSPAIEKAKLSVKVATAEINESRRRLNNNGSTGYGSYGGGKSMLGAGSVLAGEAPLSAASGRLRGGNSSPTLNTQYSHGQAGLDLSAAERLTELRARLEPFMKPRPTAQASSASTQPAAEDGGALPHWGLRKRLRRSRFEVPKDDGVHEWGGRGGCEAEGGASGEDCGVKGRGHSWASRSVSLEATRDAHSAMAAAPTPPRNGVCSRPSPAPTSAATRQGSSAERERGLLQLHKGELSSSALKQRSDGSAERPIKDHSNGPQPVARSRAISTTAMAMASEMGAASCSAKPRSDLQSLEWPRILIGLSRKEKEDDFLRIKGTKLPQRPKKRPKAAERALHYCTPGSSLCDLSRGRYDVREKKSTKKRPRGLKAMESLDSDTD